MNDREQNTGVGSTDCQALQTRLDETNKVRDMVICIWNIRKIFLYFFSIFFDTLILLRLTGA